MFFSAPPAKDEKALREYALRVFGPEAERFLAFFSRPADEESIRREGSVNSIEFALRLAAEQRQQAGSGLPLYAYSFQADIPGWDHPGTFHSVDLWFFFETLAKCWRPFRGQHYDLARQMCDYWCNFIRTGDPNGTGSDGETLPGWPALDPKAPVRMAFAGPAAPEECPASPLVRFLMDRYRERTENE